MRKTLVIGASENPQRYSFLAMNSLKNHGHEVEAVGLKQGIVAGIPIQTGKPELAGIDTVTLYVGPQNQPELYEYIVGLKPKRVIFNPGTENPEFEQLLAKNKIETEQACTLVLLNTDQYE